MIAGLNGLPAQPTRDGDTPEKVHKAAGQFEALLLTQLLRAAREAGGSGWLGTGEDDDAGSTAMEMAEEQFAQVLSAGGGLGLADLVAQGLQHRPGTSSAPAPAAASQRVQEE